MKKTVVGRLDGIIQTKLLKAGDDSVEKHGQDSRLFTRRQFGKTYLAALFQAFASQAMSCQSAEAKSLKEYVPDIINLPMQECAGSLCTVYAVDGHYFRGVLDTGSPFLTVPKSCSPQWGCWEGGYDPSGLDDTVEVYAADEGTVEWKKGLVSFGSFQNPQTGANMTWGEPGLVFGLLPNTLVRYSGGGGVFIGLVKYKEDDIRPTFLGQTSFQSLRFNFPEKQLFLSTKPLISKSIDAIKLADLRPLGDPVFHYACESNGVWVNGQLLAPEEGAPAAALLAAPRLGDGRPPPGVSDKKTYVVFDTGCTGMILSEELFAAAVRRAKGTGERFFGTVQVELPTERGGRVALQARAPLTTSTPVPWPGLAREGAHLVVLGLAFLKKKTLTIDADKGRLYLEA